MLLGNYTSLNANPGRAIGGFTNYGGTRKSATTYLLYVSDANISDQTEKGSLPNGYYPPYTWTLAPEAGGISSFSQLDGLGYVNTGNLAGGLNAVSTLTGVGTITNADLALIASAVATLSGIGTLTGDVIGTLNASATLAGTGNLTGALGALANAVSAIIGSGTISSADMRAIANMNADITPFTELSPENLAAAVWNAVAAVYNDAGTTGNKLNSAGGAADPWDDARALTVGKFLGLK